MDIGCGNGRNTKFLRSKRFDYPLCMISMGLDISTKEYADAVKCHLGHEPFPKHFWGSCFQVFLANYVFMFLDQKERQQVIREIQKQSTEDTRIMVELYPSKNSYITSKAAVLKLQQEIFDALGWDKIHWAQGRFIARKPLSAEGKMAVESCGHYRTKEIV